MFDRVVFMCCRGGERGWEREGEGGREGGRAGEREKRWSKDGERDCRGRESECARSVDAQCARSADAQCTHHCAHTHARTRHRMVVYTHLSLRASESCISLPSLSSNLVHIPHAVSLCTHVSPPSPH